MRRIPVVIAIGSALCLTAPASHALTFGRVDNATVLGQPLDFAAVVAASVGDDSVDSECLAADVFAGDNKLPAPLVRVRIEPNGDGRQASVRVTTTVRIDEPVVTVNLMIGCPVKLSRRFVAFVDPPVIALPNVASETTSGPGSAANDGLRDAPPTTSSVSPTAGAASASVPSRIAARPPRRPANVVARAAATHPKAGPARSAGTSASAAARSGALAAGTGASVPSRLVLDSAPAGGSVTPISAAASAILAAELESYAKELAVERQRMQLLEQSVERMRRENEATRASLAQVQSQLHDADAARGPAGWVYGLIALLVAAIGGLLWRQYRLNRRAAWWTDSNAAPVAGAGAVESTPAFDVAPAFVPASLRGAAAVTEEVTVAAVAPIAPGPLPMRDAPPAVARGAVSHFDTQPMPPGTFVRPRDDDDKPGRELSVEELIDMEQQAEFFVVLGQDDAAIDLLMGLVRSSGGQTPMPYLKLLEIYRRLGLGPAYDRIRERFNQRFNGSAPSLDDDPSLGLDLAGYPDVLGRIQAAWAQPQQVLGMVERLMPRSGTDEPGTPFDLEAFSELLFLSRIARDLSDVDSGIHGVDFLLPLDSDPLIEGPATLSLHAPYEPHKPMVDLTLDLDMGMDMGMDLSPPAR